MNMKERIKMEEQEESVLLSPKRTFYVPDSEAEEQTDNPQTAGKTGTDAE